MGSISKPPILKRPKLECPTMMYKKQNMNNSNVDLNKRTNELKCLLKDINNQSSGKLEMPSENNPKCSPRSSEEMNASFSLSDCKPSNNNPGSNLMLNFEEYK